MSTWIASLLLASVVGAASGSALAHPATTDAPSTTMPQVTVQSAPAKAIKRQADAFVRRYAAAPNPEIDQIGRWRDAVCVQIVGLARADQAEAMKSRIEGVAKAVGLPAPRPGCAANVEIVFSDQPQHVMDIVARRREYLLGYYHFHDRDRLKTVTAPIQSWYVTSTSSPAGGIAAIVFQPELDLNPTAASRMGAIDDPENHPPPGCGDATHFTACYRSAFDNVFIVADSKALAGEDSGVVADDMAMLTLSQPRAFDGCNALPSVLDRFAKSACPGRAPPDGLTPGDAAYLTALYAADLEARLTFEQGDIARRMAAILIKASEVETKPDRLQMNAR